MTTNALKALALAAIIALSAGTAAVTPVAAQTQDPTSDDFGLSPMEDPRNYHSANGEVYLPAEPPTDIILSLENSYDGDVRLVENLTYSSASSTVTGKSSSIGGLEPSTDTVKIPAPDMTGDVTVTAVTSDPDGSGLTNVTLGTVELYDATKVAQPYVFETAAEPGKMITANIRLRTVTGTVTDNTVDVTVEANGSTVGSTTAVVDSNTETVRYQIPDDVAASAQNVTMTVTPRNPALVPGLYTFTGKEMDVTWTTDRTVLGGGGGVSSTSGDGLDGIPMTGAVIGVGALAGAFLILRD